MSKLNEILDEYLSINGEPVFSGEHMANLNQAINAYIAEEKQKWYEIAHKEGETCMTASIQAMLVNDFGDPEKLPETIDEITKYLKSYIAEVIGEDERADIVRTSNPLQLAHNLVLNQLKYEQRKRAGL